MRNLFSMGLTLLFSVQTFAAEVWIATPTPVTREQSDELTDKFRTLIRDADIVSAYDTLLSHPASPSQMAVVLDLDSIARAASLNGNFKKAFDHYQKLAALLKDLPNVSGLEKIMLSTKVNLAHMATMLKMRDSERRWRDAHAWAPDGTLSPEEFSPTVILKFSKPSQIVKRQRISLKSDISISLFVDGQKLKPLAQNYTLFLEPGAHQIAALAPGMTWSVTNFKVTDQKMSLNVTATPLISGTCDAPQILTRDIPPKVKVVGVFDDDCAKVYSKNSWYTLEGAKLSLPVKEVHLSNNLKPSGSVASLQTTDDKRSTASKIFKSPWFWAGVGAVLVGALVISSHQTTTVPSHTVSN